MAFIGIRVPAETGRLFSDIEVPGEQVKANTYHVTVLYLGKDLEIDSLAEAIKATYRVTSTTKPFSVRTSRVASFPKNEDGVPVIARVESDPLHDLRERLVKAFEEAGIEFNNDYPLYKPHVTLAWGDEEIEDEQRIPTTIEWGAHELVLWGGDDGDKKLTATFPFTLKTEIPPES
jgi:2'-5' RNA ligase